MGTPQIIRRQAYWTMLSGGAGEAYGADMWFFPADWKQRLLYPGAVQLRHFISFFESIPWHTLEPDVRHQAVVAGYGDWTKNNYVTTAVSVDKKLMVSYLPEIQPVHVDFNYLSGSSFNYYWLNPATGEKSQTFKITAKSVQRLSPQNGQDWVLVVSAN